jgi:aryl carrier-like protein
MTGAVATAEAMLCEIIADLLGLDLVRPDDGFFEVGGDSVLALQVVARAREAGLTFSVRDLFDNQTAEALAAVTGGPAAAVSVSAVAAPAEAPLLTFAADERDEVEDTETGEQADDTEAGWE